MTTNSRISICKELLKYGFEYKLPIPNENIKLETLFWAISKAPEVRNICRKEEFHRYRGAIRSFKKDRTFHVP